MEDVHIEQILFLSKIHPLKVKNIYLFGSRLYGCHTLLSDYDILVLANSMNEHVEIKDSKYNIHIKTPDIFKAELMNHFIQPLECLYAPDWAKIQEKEKINFKIHPNNLKQKLLSQSFDSWHKAKMKINNSDIIRGNKSAFHSLRILMFGIQILKHKKIVDYSEANYILKDLEESEIYEWGYLKEKYFSLKIKLEKQFKGI